MARLRTRAAAAVPQGSAATAIDLTVHVNDSNAPPLLPPPSPSYPTTVAILATSKRADATRDATPDFASPKQAHTSSSSSHADDVPAANAHLVLGEGSDDDPYELGCLLRGSGPCLLRRSPRLDLFPHDTYELWQVVIVAGGVIRYEWLRRHNIKKDYEELLSELVMARDTGLHVWRPLVTAWTQPQAKKKGPKAIRDEVLRCLREMTEEDAAEHRRQVRCRRASDKV